MSEGQKVIKYCAIAFAVFLAVSIITGIASAAFAVVHVISGKDVETGKWNGKTINVSKTFTGVESLDIDNSSGVLKIVVGDEFRVEAENVSEDFEAKVSGGGRLSIKDNGRGIHFLWFNLNRIDGPNSKITLYIPAGFIAKDAKLETGAGNVSVDGLQADYLKISAGAGNISGSGLTADEVKIDGGVGKVNLSSVNFKDADFDCGVGNLDIDGILLGKTKIDCGIGEVVLSLKGNADDYGLDIDSGLGKVRLNGEKVSKEQTNSNAENLIKIDGGIGDVDINFEE